MAAPRTLIFTSAFSARSAKVWKLHRPGIAGGHPA